MQTFVPYPDFALSAKVLDRARLGKQRVETWQIIQSLTVQEYGWKNHPATKMWRGHVAALASYGVAVCDEWIARGYKDSLRPRFEALASPQAPLPAWWGRPDVHASHRSRLLEKDASWYGQFGWSDIPGGYVWPVT
jgi:hypothetical protein